jgi:hypothetical protein
MKKKEKIDQSRSLMRFRNSPLFFLRQLILEKKTKIGNTSSTNPTTLPFQSTHTQAYTESRDSE